MRRKVVFDPMAGEHARRVNELPEKPQPILDPTDPRYGLGELDRRTGTRRETGGQDREPQGRRLAS